MPVMKSTGLTIIVPTYNEVANIEILIKRIVDALKDHRISYEILIVDDNSPDGTWKRVMSLNEKYPVRLLKRIYKRGLATAVIDGIKSAQAEKIIVMDADLQHPPEKIPEIYHALFDNDIVVASRYTVGGGIIGWSLKRKIISAGAKLLAYLLLPPSRRTSDPMSGFFGIRKNVIKGINMNPRGYKILLEILVRGKYGKVTDVPYIFKSRIRGRSKMGIKEITAYMSHLISLAKTSGHFWRIILILTFLVILAIVSIAAMFFF